MKNLAKGILLTIKIDDENYKNCKEEFQQKANGDVKEFLKYYDKKLHKAVNEACFQLNLDDEMNKLIFITVRFASDEIIDWAKNIIKSNQCEKLK